MTDQPAEHDAQQTGLWVVLVYETADYLLAVHGPYASHAHAGQHHAKAADLINAEKGGHIDIVPLWRPEDVGKP